MTEQTQPTDALAKLRHLYANMLNGGVRDTASAKRIAEGLLSPAIAELEKWGTPAGAGEPYGYVYTAQVAPIVGDERKVERTVFTRNKPPCNAFALYTTPQPTQAQASFKSGAKSFQTYAEANAYSKGYYAGKKAATKAQAGAVPLTAGWCTHCGEGVTNFCRSKCGDRVCPIGLPRIKGADHG